MKRVICTVTNDLSQDQRMNRICTSLAQAGYDVTLVGRKRSFSSALPEQPYRQVRLRNLFNRGKYFYLEFNLRLFLYMLFHKADVICSVDLDTILAGRWASWWKGRPLVYDAHEYFTEMEEVVTRPAVKKIWERIERKSMPKVRVACTISEGYANMFKEKYGKQFEVVRNVPLLKDLPDVVKTEQYILYQGAVNVGRGLPELVRSMSMVDARLYIVGRGDILQELTRQVEELSLKKKILLWGFIPPERLWKYTLEATIGVTLFSSTGLHHQYSLANRFFDYVHAAVPQVAMNFPEYAKFNEQHRVALLIDNLEEATIAGAINQLLTDKDLYYHLKANCIRARKEVNWQIEEKKLLQLYAGLS